MKILRTYLLKELLWPFILSLAILIFIMLVGSLVNLFNLVINKGVSLSLVSTLILLLIPNILSYAIPLAILSATLLTIGRLSADNEIIAIRASGINLYKLCFPLGLKTGSQYEIKVVKGNVTCSEGKKLKEVVLIDIY